MERARTQSQQRGRGQPYHPRSRPTLSLFLSFLISKMGLLQPLQGLLWAPECQTLTLEKKVCGCSREEENLAEPVPVFCLFPERQRGYPGHSAPTLASQYLGLRLRLHSFVGLCSRWVSWVAQGNARDWRHGLERRHERTDFGPPRVRLAVSPCVCVLIFRIRSLALEPPCPTTALRTWRESGLFGPLWLFQWELGPIFPVINLTLTQQIQNRTMLRSFSTLPEIAALHGVPLSQVPTAIVNPKVFR